MIHADNFYITGIRNRDEAVIKKIYADFYGKVKSMVISNGGSEADAADIFQDSLVSLFRKTMDPGFALSCPLEAFIYIISRNKWISRQNTLYSRKVTITDTLGYIIGDELSADLESLGIESERRKLLHTKIREMEAGCRQLLQLSWEGTALEKIAELMNTTYAYIRKKKSVCTSKLIEMVRSSPEFLLLKW